MAKTKKQADTVATSDDTKVTESPKNASAVVKPTVRVSTGKQVYKPIPRFRSGCPNC